MGIVHSQVDKEHSSSANVHTRLQVIPRSSERTIDPLIAARLYNDKHSPIFQLPEEVLLQIISNCCAYDSIVTLYSLRRVSKTFRRLVHDPSIWQHMLSPSPDISDLYNTEDYWNLPVEQWRQLEGYIQRDGLCTRCRPARPGHHNPGCKFYSETGRRLYCRECGSRHDEHEFPLSGTDAGRQRQCLGRQGGVQLCEHTHIYWADIEEHITAWKKLRPRDYWGYCLGSFNIECRDPSHDTHCAAGLPGTWPWPRATLAATWEGASLILEWEAHSSPMALVITPDGHAHLPAPALRALFQRYRDEAGGILFPCNPSAQSLPEMVCFSQARCACVHYEDMNAPPPQYDYSEGAFLPPRRDTGELDEPVCLITTYRCTIRISGEGNSRTSPSHEWLHAMDPDTYDPPHAEDQPVYGILSETRGLQMWEPGPYHPPPLQSVQR